MWEEKLQLYDKIIAKCPEFERKGKSMPYTSANGYMFSQLNKAGEVGIRLPADKMKEFMETYDSGEFRSYGAVMKEYVLVPESLLEKPDLLAKYLQISHDYVRSLPPK